MFSKKIFSERLKALRTAQYLKQNTLAEAIGVTDKTVSALEVGLRAPSVEVLCLLADYFGVSTDYLLGREPPTDKGKV